MVISMAVWFSVFFITFLYCARAELQLNDCEAVAKIDSGYVCGLLAKDVKGEEFASFRGIPYAKQPLGELRFQELQPSEPFTEVFDARNNGPVCPQINSYENRFGSPMGEDCIRINVYTPANALPNLAEPEKSKLVPILMFIHGGSFEEGSGNPDLFGPEYLISKGIMVVTFNFRLGIFGFLSLGSSSIPGNNGVRDAITALRWLNRNAKSFGGDPDQVTLGGQSSGAVMAHLISLSPAVKGEGLFKRVFALSGNALSNFISFSPSYAKVISSRFLSWMRIDPSQDPEVIHQQLITAPLETILNAVANQRSQTLELFSPVLESPQENFTTVVPKDPEVLMKEGAGKEYPLLLGYTSNECEAFRKKWESKIQASLEAGSYLPPNLLHMADIFNVGILSTKMLNRYFGGKVNGINYDKFIPYCEDALYKYPAIRVTKNRLSVGAAPTYVYEFGYHAFFSIMRLVMGVDFKGACHSEDMFNIFRLNKAFGRTSKNELRHFDPDTKMKERMTSMIAGFVKTGEPAPKEEGQGQQKSLWPPTDDRLQIQRIYHPTKFDFRAPSKRLNRTYEFYDDMYSMLEYD